jgi:hypothetical protein
MIDTELHLPISLEFTFLRHVFCLTHFYVIYRICLLAIHLLVILVSLIDLDSERSKQEGGVFITRRVAR